MKTERSVHLIGLSVHLTVIIAACRNRLGDSVMLTSLLSAAAISTQQPTEISIQSQPIDYLAAFADGATVLAVFVGLLAAIFTLMVHERTQQQDERMLAMNLFERYLALRIDDTKFRLINDLGNVSRSLSEEYVDQYCSARMNILEELFEWINRQPGPNKFWAHLAAGNFAMAFSKQERLHVRDTTWAWRKTIESHLREDREDCLENLRFYGHCYSVNFLIFAAEVYGDGQLKQFASASLKAVQTNTDRPNFNDVCPANDADYVECAGGNLPNNNDSAATI